MEIIEKIKNWWRQFKLIIKNLIIYFPIVINMRNWDYVYILGMMQFQLLELLKTIENGLEIDETRIPKEHNIKKTLELLKSITEYDYLERSGYNDNRDYEWGSDEFHKINLKARDLEESEWNELFDILKRDMRGWWD